MAARVLAALEMPGARALAPHPRGDAGLPAIGSRGPGTEAARVARYFYAQVSVIDPKTMRVIEASHRWDSEKLFDPRVDGANVEDQFPPDVLGARLERFVELSTAQALCEAFGSVTVSEPRIVPSRP